MFSCLKRKHMTIFHKSIVSACNIYAAKTDWSPVVVYPPQVQHNELYHLRSATALLYKVGRMLIWPRREIQILWTLLSSHSHAEMLRVAHFPDPLPICCRGLIQECINKKLISEDRRCWQQKIPLQRRCFKLNFELNVCLKNQGFCFVIVKDYNGLFFYFFL